MNNDWPQASGTAKTALRRQWRPRRLALLEASQQALLNVALVVVPPLVGPGQRLGLYWPLAGEPDLLALAERLPGRLALPAVVARNVDSHLKLTYRAWNPAEPLKSDGCGVPAPAAGRALEPAELALMLVPALAFDGRGLRLGSGGGWYDRLRQEPAWRAVPALIVAPAGCSVPTLPADPWDVPFDGRLDENGLHWLQPV
ncbi:5-formyltetrahydrofolate cyclo-ligase [Cyanobium sp. Morenito 9A2]|uniref:5-formyltetrahydrofolate cyclo-ligase n=1 Tax=Cyanobium sp. Morenito 9A2 TaxID=2823718 RepID=UPI0020CF7EBD|nr:5-formyltetrahydrofolate cyclo-ligase [Cyanobium sp. Morenito 9A2]MCP9850721.1 5-formyltetrahydrofolate cyclo-ligase [Cyanobium sp. Morenito 9A2]